MNHLAHIKLASATPQLLVGNFLADDIKGRLNGQYSPEIKLGIQLHRVIDAFTDTHPVVLYSHTRLDRKYRRYGGIITDIIFDHFLAVDWQQYDDRPLNLFCRDILHQVLNHSELLPAATLERCQRMQAHRSLEQYGETAFIEHSFNYLSGRFKRENPLANAYCQFEEFGDDLKADFKEFFPQLESFVADWIEQHQC